MLTIGHRFPLKRATEPFDFGSPLTCSSPSSPARAADGIIVVAVVVVDIAIVTVENVGVVIVV